MFSNVSKRSCPELVEGFKRSCLELACGELACTACPEPAEGSLVEVSNQSKGLHVFALPILPNYYNLTHQTLFLKIPILCV